MLPMSVVERARSRAYIRCRLSQNSGVHLVRNAVFRRPVLLDSLDVRQSICSEMGGANLARASWSGEMSHAYRGVSYPVGPFEYQIEEFGL